MRLRLSWRRWMPDQPSHTAATRTTEFAIEVVARMAIFNQLDKIEWEDYPDIGEDDWQEVLDRIDTIGYGLKPMDDDYAEAYALLESRAEKEA
jgi:hypothetical protein